MELSKREKRKLKLEKLRQQSREAQSEHEQRQQEFHQVYTKESQSKLKWVYVFSVIGLIVLAIAVYGVYSVTRPGRYDNFAKCLSEKGAVMYGAMGWCKYTQAQKAMFGNSFKYITYKEYSEMPGIKTTPTWVINGKWLENVQSFDRLAAETGCKV